MSGLFNGKTFVREYAPGTPFARDWFGRYGGRIEVKAGLWSPGKSSTQKPNVSVTCAFVSNGRAGYCGGGAAHKEIVAAFPNLARIIRAHLCSGASGLPMHYVENAIYWWEIAKTDHQPANENFRNHCLWGVASGDDQDDPLLWEATEIDRLRERLEARIPALRAEVRGALEELGIDPDWNP